MDELRELINAIDAGDSDQAIAVLGANPAIASALTPDGLPVLLYALYRGQRPVAQAIAGARDDLDVFEAAAVGNPSRVRALLDADPGLAQAASPDGFSALGYAAFFGGDVGTVDALLAAGADPNRPAARSRVTPLHSAVAARNPAIVETLLRGGADPNVQQTGGFTPLQAAAQHGDDSIVELLLAAGARPELAADDGRDAAAFARAAGFADLAGRLTAGA